MLSFDASMFIAFYAAEGSSMRNLWKTWKMRKL